MVKRIAKWTALLLIVLVAIGLAFVLWQESEPHSADDIRRYSGLLNEIAAIDVPHNDFLSDEQRRYHAVLLQKVESGMKLNPGESSEYRQLIQSVLFNYQSRLVWLDRNLTVLSDVGMDRRNNIGGRGISGHHDHHDASARKNFADLSSALDRMEAANGWPISRVLSANRAYKNLTDIVLHLAVGVHSVSVEYQPPGVLPDPGSMASDFEILLKAFKAAQFEPVNSPAYVADINQALDAYDRLVVTTQTRINAALSPLERRLAGRWLAIHTIAPQPDPQMKVRFQR